MPLGDHVLELLGEQQVEEGVGLHGVGGCTHLVDERAELPRRIKDRSALVLGHVLQAREQRREETKPSVSMGLGGNEVRSASGVQSGVHLGRQDDPGGEHRQDPGDVLALLRAAGIELGQQEHVEQLRSDLDLARLKPLQLACEPLDERA